MISLSKVQIQESINQLLEEENGLNEVLQMTLNGLIYAERSEFLSQSENKKGNGYRYAKVVGIGSSRFTDYFVCASLASCMASFSLYKASPMFNSYLLNCFTG